MGKKETEKKKQAINDFDFCKRVTDRLREAMGELSQRALVKGLELLGIQISQQAISIYMQNAENIKLKHLYAIKCYLNIPWSKLFPEYEDEVNEEAAEHYEKAFEEYLKTTDNYNDKTKKLIASKLKKKIIMFENSIGKR